MRLIPVVSSMLAALGYNADREILVAQFNKDGSYYQYNGVPEGVFVSVITAESQGLAFDQFVKRGGYFFKRVTPEEVNAL